MGCGKQSQAFDGATIQKDKVKLAEKISASEITESTPNKKIEDIKKTQSGRFVIQSSMFLVENKGKLRDNYQIGKVLGSGAFGEVRVGTHILTGEQRAIKIIGKQNVEKHALFLSEVNILQKCDHPNIVRIYEFFQDAQRYYLVTELCTGGELFEKISKEQQFSELKAAYYLKQIIGAVRYCHEKNIVHRDLKPENLLLDNQNENAQIKIIDFGTSTCLDPNRKLNETFGTVSYNTAILYSS